jgi:hypothetical protein
MLKKQIYVFQVSDQLGLTNMEKEKSAAKKRQLDSQASDHVEKVS